MLKYFIKVICVLFCYITSYAQNSNVTVKTIFGQTGASQMDGPAKYGDPVAKFGAPYAMAFDKYGNMYFYDDDNYQIKKIDTNGFITTIAGNGKKAYLDGLAKTSSFCFVTAIVIDSVGNLIIADWGNNKIRKITPSGVVSTINKGAYGHRDGDISIAEFRYPFGMVFDSKGNLFVSDNSSNNLRKITPDGMVSTVAGSDYIQGFQDGLGNQARFNRISGLAIDSLDNIYACDTYNYRIRKITSSGVVTTLAGNYTAASVDGTGLNASFYSPKYLTIDKLGNLYTPEYLTSKLRKITPTGVVTSFASSIFAAGGIAIDSLSNLYVSLYESKKIVKVTSYDKVATFAGGVIGNQDGYKNLFSYFFTAVVKDSTGNIFAAADQKIFKIGLDGIATLFAGNDNVANIDGVGNLASFMLISDMTIDSHDNIYVTSGNCVRKITKNAVVTTFAGATTSGFANGYRLNATFSNPCALEFDKRGHLFIVDYYNYCIRKIDTNGYVTTFAGDKVIGYDTDGVGTLARFNSPRDLAIDTSGNIYVTDNNGLNRFKIRKITTDAVVTTLYNDANYYCLTIDIDGNIYAFHNSYKTIDKITPDGQISTLLDNVSTKKIDKDINGNILFTSGTSIQELNFNLITTLTKTDEVTDEPMYLFPNPSKGKIFLRNRSDIRVIDNLGNVIYDGNYSDITLPKGLYICQIITTFGVITQKVMVE